jgi:hypothetical protein
MPLLLLRCPEVLLSLLQVCLDGVTQLHGRITHSTADKLSRIMAALTTTSQRMTVETCPKPC